MCEDSRQLSAEEEECTLRSGRGRRGGRIDGARARTRLARARNTIVEFVEAGRYNHRLRMHLAYLGKRLEWLSKQPGMAGVIPSTMIKYQRIRFQNAVQNTRTQTCK